LGVVGEQTDSWAYDLADGTNTPRQLVDAEGAVTFSASYTPWGDTLETHGVGNFSFGYLGGLMDTSTGLLYMGNGQYYDPSTGRFLNRNAKPDQINPYVPWGGNPSAAFMAPLALLSLLYSRKKKRGKLDTFIILLVLGVALSMSLSACDWAVTVTPTQNPNPNLPPILTVTVTPTSTPGPTYVFTLTPTVTPTLPSGCAGGIWWSGYEEDTNNLENIAKRLYFEGASSFIDHSVRKDVFMAQAWALRTLAKYLYPGQSYSWITENAFSVHAQKDGEKWTDDNNYKEITRCILNSQPCAYGPNPWTIGETTGKAIQWISPQNFNRRDSAGQAIAIHTDKIGGCSTGKGCQLPDMRARQWIENLPSSGGWIESYVDLGLIDTTGDNKPDLDECYWKGVYFFADQQSFHAASNGKYYPPPTIADQETLKCPQGGGEKVNLPPMPALFSSP
jgi:RHS repeat-associated protein